MKQPPYPALPFSLTDENGKIRSLDDYSGKWIVLYFYPKDDTPGCTVEACSLRDARDDITALGAEVIGISRDDTSSHEKFKVVKVYGRVTPLGHGEQVVADLKRLQAK